MIFDGLGNITDMVKKARNIQSEIKNVQKELKDLEIVEDSGGVRVVVSGDLQLKEFKIDPAVFDNDKARAEYLISDAVNKAYGRARDEATSKLKKAAGGVSIPGLF